jgi:hypothetical protein
MPHAHNTATDSTLLSLLITMTIILIVIGAHLFLRNKGKKDYTPPTGQARARELFQDFESNERPTDSGCRSLNLDQGLEDIFIYDNVNPNYQEESKRSHDDYAREHLSNERLDDNHRKWVNNLPTNGRYLRQEVDHNPIIMIGMRSMSTFIPPKQYGLMGQQIEYGFADPYA